MSDKNLRAGLIRLAHTNPELRAELLPLLAQSKQASRVDNHPVMTKFQSQKAPFKAALAKVIAGMTEYQEVMATIKNDREMPPKAVELAKRGLHTVDREIMRWKAIGDDIHEIEGAIKDILLSMHDF